MFALATMFLTNSLAVARRLNRKCDNNHRHQALTEGRAAAVQEYPDGLCDAFLEGLEDKDNRSISIGAVGVVKETKGASFEYEEDGDRMECCDAKLLARHCTRRK